MAAISFVPRKFDLEANADRLDRAFSEAAAVAQNGYTNVENLNELAGDPVGGQ